MRDLSLDGTMPSMILEWHDIVILIMDDKASTLLSFLTLSSKLILIDLSIESSQEIKRIFRIAASVA